MPAGKTRRPGCENCRARHLKCDRSIPCAPCAKKGLTCQRPQRLRFSHSFYSNRDLSLIRRSTRKLQRTIPRQKIQFVDQTIETVRSYDVGQSEDDQFHNDSNGLDGLLSDAHGSADEQGTSEDIDPALTAVNNAKWQTSDVAALSNLSNDSISDRDLITGLQTWCYQNLSSGESPGVVGNLSSPLSLSSNKSYPPHRTVIARQVDAKLVQNFLENVGPALDPWDDCGGLSADVLELAVEHPDLLETLLKVSATHISFLGIQNEIQCNESFQKRLASPLAAVRELGGGGPTAKSIALLQQTLHNITGSAFDLGNGSVADEIWTTQHNPHYVASPESKVHWASLWQEMFLSVMQQRPVNVNINNPCFNQDAQGNDDRSWANRMLLHLLDAIQYCFGEERSPAAYDRLVSYLATWAESKPASFRPLFIRKSLHGAVFPEIWLLNSAVVAGLQWYHLARILLLANNPRLPQFGAAKRSAKRSRDDQIRDDVSVICGIAESIEETTPAHLTACMAIALVGDRFTNHDKQLALLNILDKATAKFGWATMSTRDDLKETWAWNSSS